MTSWLKDHGLAPEYHAAELAQVDDSIRADIAAYLDNLDAHMRKGEGLLLTGTWGTGKTNILALLMKAAYGTGEKPRYAWFVYCQELFDCLTRMTEEQKQQFWRWEHAELLCIDGFGEGYEHDWPYSKFEMFIEKRKTNRLTTCITTNLAVADLKKNPKYIRLIDRLKTCCYAFELCGKSRRKELNIKNLNEGKGL